MKHKKTISSANKFFGCITQKPISEDGFAQEGSLKIFMTNTDPDSQSAPLKREKSTLSEAEKQSNTQHAMVLQDASDYLLALRGFATNNDFLYLKSIIEPVITESLRQVEVLHQKIKSHTIAKTNIGEGATLSQREVECLQLCSLGKTFWETGTILGISERTVCFHLASARRKLDTTTNAHCIAKAIRENILR